jgi:hypothetical protein
LAAGGVKQCVDCGAKFLDDCPFYKGSFLEAAEAQCERRHVMTFKTPAVLLVCFLCFEQQQRSVAAVRGCKKAFLPLDFRL